MTARAAEISNMFVRSFVRTFVRSFFFAQGIGEIVYVEFHSPRMTGAKLLKGLSSQIVGAGKN